MSAETGKYQKKRHGGDAETSSKDPVRIREAPSVFHSSDILDGSQSMRQTKTRSLGFQYQARQAEVNCFIQMSPRVLPA